MLLSRTMEQEEMTNQSPMFCTAVAVALASLATTAAVEADESTNASANVQSSSQSADQSSTDLVELKLPDGSTQVFLDGRFASGLVATPTSDGGYEVSCHTGHDLVERASHAEQVRAGALPKPNRTAPPAPRSLPAVKEEK